jgi:hypothetical protein
MMSVTYSAIGIGLLTDYKVNLLIHQKRSATDLAAGSLVHQQVSTRKEHRIVKHQHELPLT